jgi:hypothetical protein
MPAHEPGSRPSIASLLFRSTIVSSAPSDDFENARRCSPEGIGGPARETLTSATQPSQTTSCFLAYQALTLGA